MKKKILLRTLIPLATIGITLGTALPLVSCSCGNDTNTSLRIDLLGEDTLEDGTPVILGTVNEAGTHSFRICDHLGNIIDKENIDNITLTKVNGTPSIAGKVDYRAPGSGEDTFHLDWKDNTTTPTKYQIIIKATTLDGQTGSLLVHLDIRARTPSAFTIDDTNFSTYFEGALPNIENLKGSALSDDMFANNTNKLIFNIDNLVIDDDVFETCAALFDVSSPFPIEFQGSGSLSIGNNAFDSCGGISQIICSSTAAPTISIGDAAFSSCTSLTGFSRGGQADKINISSIGSFAFGSCFNLKYEEINESILTISDCNWTGNDVTKSGYWLKTGATSLETAGCLAVGAISCPPSWTSIDNSAFDYCSSITSIDNLPGGSIGYRAFGECVNLITVTFLGSGSANKITAIGEYAFINCTKLHAINLGVGYDSSSGDIDNTAFGGCADGGIVSGTDKHDFLSNAQAAGLGSGWKTSL